MENESVANILQIVKATLLGIACSLFLTVVFAIVLTIGNFSDKLILPVNTCLKAVSIFVGCALGVRGEKGWIKGLIVGLLFVCLSGLLYSLIGGDFSVSWLVLIEVLFGAVAGTLSGIFAVNIRGN